MKLEYTSIKDESSFILTDFNCASSRLLLKSHGFYKIIWCKEDKASIMVDGYSIDLKKDQVIFCTPLNILDIPFNINGLISIVFNREFYCIRDHDKEVSCNGFLFFGSSLPPVITLWERDRKSFEMILFLFEEEFEIKDHIQGEMLRTLLKRMLITSRRLVKKELVSPNLPNAQLDGIRKFNLLVEKHFREEHQVAFYADALHKSAKTLSNQFKKYNDKSPLKVINDRIVLEAKRLLLYSDKTAEEIAYELGYKEPGHFSKFFKKQTSFSPIEFKKMHLGDH